MNGHYQLAGWYSAAMEFYRSYYPALGNCKFIVGIETQSQLKTTGHYRNGCFICATDCLIPRREIGGYTIPTRKHVMAFAELQ